MEHASPQRTCGDDLMRSFRLTARGHVRASAPAHSLAHGVLSAHLHDLLQMCGDGIRFEQLRQFMPPRTLRESLDMLLAMGLVEGVEHSPMQLAAT